MSTKTLFTCDHHQYSTYKDPTTSDPIAKQWLVASVAARSVYVTHAGFAEIPRGAKHFCSWQCFERWAKDIVIPPEPIPPTPVVEVSTTGTDQEEPF